METSPIPAGTSGIAEEYPHPSAAWQDRIKRYVAPVEGQTDQTELGRDGTEYEQSPHPGDTRRRVARDADQPPQEPGRRDQRTAQRHLLFISTAGGYELVERDGPAPPLGRRIEMLEQASFFLVMKLGTSPLPNDHRTCAYLEPTT